MPRRALLSQQERDALLAFPKSEEEWIRHYTLTDADRAVIAQHRGGHNRLGFAVQLCLLRYPGFVLQREQAPPNRLLHFVFLQGRRGHEAYQNGSSRDQIQLGFLSIKSLTPAIKSFT